MRLIVLPGDGSVTKPKHPPSLSVKLETLRGACALELKVHSQSRGHKEVVGFSNCHLECNIL